jgi:hypothetical protein
VSANFASQAATIVENIINVSFLVGCGGKTGTATIPARRHAINAIMKSREGGYTSTALYTYRIYQDKTYSNIMKKRKRF